MSRAGKSVEQAFAAAAVDPSRWNAAMEAAASATGAYGAALFPVQGRLPNLPHSPSLAASFESYVADGWIECDERYRALPIFLQGRVATEFDFISPEEIERHPYYQEFLAPHDLRWCALVPVFSGEDQWCLSIQRTIAQGPFTHQEITRLKALSTKLGSAAALAGALGFARMEAALQAFELSGSAVVLLDRFSNVLRANAAAERVLRGDPRIERRRIVSRDRHATAALERALHEVIWNRSAAALLPPVPLPRVDRHPVLAYPSRLSAVSADALAQCQAVIILVDPDERPRPPEAALREGFKLTVAEARLAMRLATGEPLDQAAAVLGVAKETARVQLKSIFTKLDLHRQAELVALLARLLCRGPAA